MTVTETLILQPGAVVLGEMRKIAKGGVRLALDDGSRARVDAGSEVVRDLLARDVTVYGVNTGVGLLEKTRIDADSLRQMQRNLILSHSAGTGEFLDDEAVRLILSLKIIGLAHGHSGVRYPLIEALMHFHNHAVYPCIPAKGSVGASGDLAPLAHLCAPLLGAGRVRHNGKILTAEDGLRIAALEPLELAPKEGLAMLNGTQVSTALALKGLFAIEDVFAGAMVAGSISVDAAKGSDTPFDPRIHDLRPHPGQVAVAAKFRWLLAGSEIRRSHLDCERVQDAYSLRCQPQVMGACLDQINHAAAILEREANAVTDNPLIFPDSGDVLSGGNFHAEPVAMAADILAIAVAEVGAISERRVALLIDPAMTDLPPFLVQNSGLNSGFMIAQVTAAALASENKSMAHPASVDSLPTSANQEDHVSMSAFAARRLLEMADNANGIVAIELLAACQGIEYHRPLRSTDSLEEVISALRERVPPYDADRKFSPDIAAAKQLLASELNHALIGDLLPSLGGT